MSAISDSKIIAELDGVGLSFNRRLHHLSSFRDEFVNFFKSPFRKDLRSQRSTVIFNDLSFRVHAGDKIGLLGINGAGKTSLCRCIAGIYKPQKGNVQVTGKIRSIFDTSLGIYPELTGYENAKLLVHFLFPELKSEHEQLIQNALHFSELGEYIHAPYRIYSNGMKARLYLSVVSSAPSDLLILDEVFDGADQFFRKKISDRFESLIQKSKAVIFVNHDENQIRRVCNRGILLHQGKIIYDGPIQNALTEYDKIYS